MTFYTWPIILALTAYTGCQCTNVLPPAKSNVSKLSTVKTGHSWKTDFFFSFSCVSPFVFPFLSSFYHSVWRATLPPPLFRLFTSNVTFAKGSPIQLQSEGLDPMSRRKGQRWGLGLAALGARSSPIRPHARGYLCSFRWSVVVADPEKGIIIKESKRGDTWRGDCPPPAGNICLKQIHISQTSSPLSIKTSAFFLIDANILLSHQTGEHLPEGIGVKTPQAASWPPGGCHPILFPFP